MAETIAASSNGSDVAINGSGENADSGHAEKHHADEKPIPSEYIDLLPQGKADCVYKCIKRAGTTDEAPVANDTVIVHYVGRLWGGARDGEKFDSSRDRGEPFQFELGKGKVIRGWDTAVATMKRGELAEIICRPAFAYGKSGTGGIPPNSTLCFEVELLDFHGEDISENKDRSLMKRTLKTGDGYEHPVEFSKVTINFTARVVGAPSGDEPYDRRDGLEFAIGEGGAVEPLPVPAGLEYALTKMKKNEHTKITISAQQAFGATGFLRDGAAIVPPNATVEYDVVLNDFVKMKETWEMTPDEKIEEARRFKERANTAFTKAHYGVAAAYYKQIIKFLENEDTGAESDLEKSADRRTLRLAAYANAAQAYLNLRNHSEALNQADKALEIDPQHPKALFRKGVAHQRVEDFEAAKDAFHKLVAIEPTNQAAQRELAVCDKRIKQQLDAEKKLYRTLFQKIATREEDELDKLEREREEKAKAERAAEEAKKKEANHHDKCDSCSDDEEQHA